MSTLMALKVKLSLEKSKSHLLKPAGSEHFDAIKIWGRCF